MMLATNPAEVPPAPLEAGLVVPCQVVVYAGVEERDVVLERLYPVR